jgi:tryptophan synthase alpha chain
LVGTTGARAQLSERLPGFLQRVRARVAQPLVVGFGISRPEHIVALRTHAQACVVASALVDLLEATPPPQQEAALHSYVAQLRATC